ncbi:uracil-DNA glycosylase family protein [Neomoorella mulderi]|nr:uracil-DNA glycosylase family protein [Moorella mulderi]
MSFLSFSKEVRLDDLCEAVRHCTLCSRLCHRTKIFSKFNGNIYSKVMFVAEAPGRLGADRTGIPLYGDKTGDNFETLLGNIGWRREDIFITNAVLCNPREENGNNSTPTREEIINCIPYLEMTIELIQPDVIVTLGQKALDALNFISPHSYKLKEQVGIPFKWERRLVVPLYHPGPRALLHRSLTKQRSDFIRLAKIVHPVKGLIKHSLRREVSHYNQEIISPKALHKLILMVIQTLGQVTYFKLTKLLYFIDLEALQRFGQTLTGEIYLRQQEGPWMPSLKKAISFMSEKEIKVFHHRIPIVSRGPSPRFSIDFNEQTLEFVLEVLDKYGNLTNTEIKTLAYRTAPMKYILKQEAQGRDMRKVPVIYNNKVSYELDGSS